MWKQFSYSVKSDLTNDDLVDINSNITIAKKNPAWGQDFAQPEFYIPTLVQL